MKDYVGAMRACWRTWQTREPFNFQSEHYNLSLMTPNFAPPPVSNPHILTPAGTKAKFTVTMSNMGLSAAGFESAYPRADRGSAGADAASCG